MRNITLDYRKDLELINESQCYLDLKIDTKILTDVEVFCKTNSNWESVRGPKGQILTFEQAFIPFYMSQSDPFIKHNYYHKPLIMKMKAKTIYHFHVDTYRSTVVNMVLDDYDSVTVFNLGYHRPAQSSIAELKYIPGRYYLFNTQIPHQVINRGSEDRYLLSMAINYSWEDALKRFMEI